MTFNPCLGVFVLTLLLAAGGGPQLEANGRGANLLANASLRTRADGAPEAWQLWAPRANIAAPGAVVTRDGARVLSLRAERYASVGKWLHLISGIEAGKYYHFDVRHQTEGVTSEANSVLVILSWYRTPEGEGEIQRDYVLVTDEEGGWTRSARTLQAPEEARSVRVELGLRWAPAGAAVYFKDARLSEVPPPEPRVVRIVTTRIVPEMAAASIDGNTGLMVDMMDRVGPLQPDVVLFSENLYSRFVKIPRLERVQPIPGPLTDALAAKAKQYGTYVITTLLEDNDGLVHNTAVLIDREGRLAGKYRKVHLTMGELEGGLTPGTEYPVFDTDFGRIGILTCWDNWFAESARALRLNGAEMLFMPLAGDGSLVHWDVTWKARAVDNGVWFVTSSTVTDSPSRIINPQGQVVADASGALGYAVADVDLNQEWRQRWMSVSSGLGEPARFMIKERRPDTYDVIVEAPAVETDR